VIPGLGSYMLRALSLPDVPVIQAVTITFVLIYVTLNLIVDISYGYLNPRVRTS
jgi:peptide/nickel transport system permease protein